MLWLLWLMRSLLWLLRPVLWLRPLLRVLLGLRSLLGLNMTRGTIGVQWWERGALVGERVGRVGGWCDGRIDATSGRLERYFLWRVL